MPEPFKYGFDMQAHGRLLYKPKRYFITLDGSPFYDPRFQTHSLSLRAATNLIDRLIKEEDERRGVIPKTSTDNVQAGNRST